MHFELTRDNYRQVLEPRLVAGDFLLNLSVDVSSLALIELCRERGALYLDTCTEPWAGGYVELLLVNGESVGFDRLLADGDRVAVYPKFERLDIRSLLKVREQPLRALRFIADAHLGGLARLLRMAGFDTLYDNAFDDQEIAEIAAREGRSMRAVLAPLLEPGIEQR